MFDNVWHKHQQRFFLSTTSKAAFREPSRLGQPTTKLSIRHYPATSPEDALRGGDQTAPAEAPHYQERRNRDIAHAWRLGDF